MERVNEKVEVYMIDNHTESYLLNGLCIDTFKHSQLQDSIRLFGSRIPQDARTKDQLVLQLRQILKKEISKNKSSTVINKPPQKSKKNTSTSTSSSESSIVIKSTTMITRLQPAAINTTTTTTTTTTNIKPKSNNIDSNNNDNSEECEKKYQCTICLDILSYRSSLIRHLKQKHNLEEDFDSQINIIDSSVNISICKKRKKTENDEHNDNNNNNNNTTTTNTSNIRHSFDEISYNSNTTSTALVPTTAASTSILATNPVFLEKLLIENFNFYPIVNRLDVGYYGHKLSKEFARFAIIKLLDNNQSAEPSPLIERFFHSLLIDTHKTKEFCKLLQFDIQNDADSIYDLIEVRRKRYERTLALYTQYFGTEIDETIWPKDYLIQQQTTPNNNNNNSSNNFNLRSSNSNNTNNYNSYSITNINYPNNNNNNNLNSLGHITNLNFSSNTPTPKQSFY